MAKYTLNPNISEKQIAGELNIAAIQRLIGVTLPSSIVYLYPGAIKHMIKNHEEDYNKYFHLIPDMIESPDYIGQNPKEPNSVEIYKVISDHVLIAIKLDPSGYMFLSSMYSLDNGQYKVQKRLKSGRIVPYKI